MRSDFVVVRPEGEGKKIGGVELRECPWDNCGNICNGYDMMAGVQLSFYFMFGKEG